MRKFAALSLLSAGAVFVLTGCALTDYCASNACTENLKKNNLTHSAVGCDDATDLGAENIPGPGTNTQQTLEPYTDDVLQRALSLPPPLLCDSNCTFTGCVGAIPGGATNEEAREWSRFIGSYAFFGEAQVLFPTSPQFQGYWALAGAKGLQSDCNADGFSDVRLNTWFCNIQAFGPFSCPTRTSGVSEVNYGGPEVQLLGHQVLNDLPQCSQPINVETIAIDTRTGAEFGRNIDALTAQRNAPGSGYSTYWGILGRIGEGKLAFVDVKPQAGLAEFFAGSQIPVDLRSVGIEGSATISGGVGNDGLINVSLHSLTYVDKSLTLSQPLTIAISRDLKLVQFDVTNQGAQLRELAAWSLENTPALFDGVTIGGFVPELGVKVPQIAMQLGRETMAGFVNNSGLGGGDRSRSR